MNITRENIDDLNAVIKLSIEKSDYETAVNETLKSYRKKVNMPGFRAGKVPAGMVKKMYGKSVLAEEVNKILSSELYKYIQSEKLDILGEPLPNDELTSEINWDKDETFNFAFDIALSPEFAIAIDKRSKLPYYNIALDAQMVDNQVEAMAQRYGTNEPTDVVAEKANIRGNFVQVDADGVEVEGGIVAEGVAVAFDLIKNEDVKGQFEGGKVGLEVTFNPIEAMENDHEVAHMLNLKPEEADKANTTFKFTVVEILQFVAAEVNEDFFKKVYGEDTDVTSVEALRAKVEEEIKGNLALSADYRFGVDAKDALLKKAKFDFPEAFMKRWIVAANENMTAEQVENDWDGMKEELRWQLVKGKIVSENEITVEEAELVQLAKEMAAMQFRQYGMFQIPEEHLDSYATSILQNKEERQRLELKKMDDKVFEFVKGKVNLEEKEISQQDFDKLFDA